MNPSSITQWPTLPAGLTLEQKIWATLKLVNDPEMDCNIVDLGLIYSMKVDSGRIEISMTATTPGCPMMDSLRFGVENALGDLEGIEEVEVNWVWDPPWTPSMMSVEGRERTGVRIR